ncbi:MAG: lysostaphin resistance A-like protein [Anaerolineae bacterium]
MNAQRNFRVVLWFVALTFGLTWALWSLLWLPAIGGNRLMALAVTTLGMWGPGVSALLVTRFALSESWRTLTLDRLGRKRYYLWAWFLPLLGTLVAMGLTIALGIARFDPESSQLQAMIEETTSTPLPIPLWTIVALQVVQAVTWAPLFNALFALGEELGWRGFLLLRLMQAGLSQRRALIVSGIIWGLWHAPVIVRGHNYPGHPYLGVLLMTVFTTLIGVIFGWLQLASGSVWVPAIAHGALNAIAGLPFLLLTPFDTAIGGMLTSIIGWIPLVAFVAWLVWSGRLPVAEKSAGSYLASDTNVSTPASGR